MSILDNLEKLKAFSVVAERGSISSASKELALSQPAITRTIQTLEASVGFSLFNRDRNGMHLTEGGQILHVTSARIQREIADAVIRGANAQKEMSGNLMVGTYESLSEYLWPDFLLKIQKEFPFLNVSLKTNSQKRNLEELRAGVLDLLVDAEPRDYAGLTLYPLYTDHFKFYSLNKIKLTTDNAQKMSLLSVKGAFDENNITVEQHLSQKGYIFQREYSFDSFTAVKRMALKGLGVAVLPLRLVKKGDSLYPIHAEGFGSNFGSHTIYATVSPHRENDKRIRVLIKLLKKQLSYL